MQNVMSALPPIADMCSALGHVRFVPIADMVDCLRVVLIPNTYITSARWAFAIARVDSNFGFKTYAEYGRTNTKNPDISCKLQS